MEEEMNLEIQKKEAKVFSDMSLSNLASKIEDGLILAMYLNIPTTVILNQTLLVSKTGLRGATDLELINTTKNLLLYWKNMRSTAKLREKVQDMDRALKETGASAIANVFLKKASHDEELTVESLSVKG